VIAGPIIPPPLIDSILPGVTRDSILQIAKLLDIESEERPVSVEELKLAFAENCISEAFGAGTAAVIAPINLIQVDGISYHLPQYNHESTMFKLKKKLQDIRVGKTKDVYGWNFVF